MVCFGDVMKRRVTGRFVLITEGSAHARVPIAEKVSKELEVFYNPVMKLNRDISVLLLKTLGETRLKESAKDPKNRHVKRPFEGFSIGSPLAGTGIRECRFLVELDEGLLKSVEINDYSEKAVKLIKENIALNEKELNSDEIEVSCNEANKFLLDSKGFGYIDIDPFGTPNPFLDSAVKRIQREGVLAVTATDTSALSGTYENACKRKYWAKPMRNHLMHEVGLRILIRKVQLIGAQYDKTLTPIYSYAKDHYMRVFFLCKKQGKRGVADLLKKHRYFHYCPSCFAVTSSEKSTGEVCNETGLIGSGNSMKRALKKRYNRTNTSKTPKRTQTSKTSTLVGGPLWVGPLWDAHLARAMAKMNKSWVYGVSENQKFLDVIADESRFSGLGFFLFNSLRELGTPLKKEEALKKKGVFPTHLEGNAVRAKSIELLF